MGGAAPAAWRRPHFTATTQRAYLLYWVFGEFGPEVGVDARRYRTHGLPHGVAGQVFAHDSVRDRPSHPLSGDLARVLRAKAPDAFDAALTAPHAMLIQGEIDDPPDLLYLRDLVGFIACALDSGGVAALDLQALALRDRADFMRDVFEPDQPRARSEVVMLRSNDDMHSGRAHLHTRGLRKFARPDLSIRNVPLDSLFNAQLVLERSADYLLAGGVLEDGRELRMSVAPPGLLPHTSGELDDPDYNTRHTKMIWPV